MNQFPEEPIYQQLARVGKAFASPVRLRLLDVLDQGECTVEELSERAGVPLKNTSAQLQHLRSAHLVTTRRDGTRIRYRVADQRVTRFLAQLQDFAHDRLADLRQAVADHLGDPAALEPVTAAELGRRLADHDTVVIDVRAPDDYLLGHVPGAISVPLAQLRDHLDELPRDREIVAYCGGPYCAVSPTAVRLLRDLGFQARPLDGGLARWRREGNHLDTGPSAGG